MEDIAALLRDSGALLEGHFLLSSGRHSDRYFQCARLFQHPDRAALALASVAAQIRRDIQAGTLQVDAVAGPALGGILVAYELGRQLGIPAFFTERDDAGIMTLRRGFEVTAGMRILIAEDVVTTGKSVGECAAALAALGGHINALACIVDRRGLGFNAHEIGIPGLSAPVPFYPAVALEAANWESGECKLCAQGISPAVKPGSRKN